MNIRNASRRERRGYSLIETVVVVGAVTIVLSLCGLVLHGMLRLDRSGRKEFDDTGTITRLARQFREDIHAGRSAEIIRETDTQKGLKVVGENRIIIYTIDGTHLHRVEQNGKGEPLGREAYRVDRLGEIHFEESNEGISSIRLKFIGDRARTNLPHRSDLGIIAKLGKDHPPGQRLENKP